MIALSRKYTASSHRRCIIALARCEPITLMLKESSMTHVQRLKYSLLIILVVLGLMLGLSHLQKQGTISEQTFQMLAIAIAVVVVVVNGILRRKVKP
jgi:predicted tellurium resistance membrane protein TerC